jgi:predicted secreted hydrolase
MGRAKIALPLPHSGPAHPVQCSSAGVQSSAAPSPPLSAPSVAPSLSKRAFHKLALAASTGAWLGSARALPERALSFPRDHGAHPGHRTEWWYITGYGNDGQRDVGFQVTFFRSRVQATQGMQSKFAAKQLLFAHAAVTDVQGNKLWHDQRIARAGFGIAQASELDTQVKLRDWQLQRSAATGVYNAQIKARDFAIDLQFTPQQPLLLQGKNGLSRKGPEEKQASYYYSLPQLQASGSILLNGQRISIKGAPSTGAAHNLATPAPQPAASAQAQSAGIANPSTKPRSAAWLDHEWSDELLHPEAVGWDWIGMNLFDGSALTAFQLRKQDGRALWTGGSFRATSSSGLQTFIAQPGEVQFQAIKGWTSPLTGAKYPIQWLVRTPADYYTVKAVIPNQELDSRSSTGAVYWEGLSDLFDSNDKHVGRGYLEMTGYTGALKI